MRARTTFHAFIARARKTPGPHQARCYFALANGVGMIGEYPYIVDREDNDAKGDGGVIETGMTRRTKN